MPWLSASGDGAALVIGSISGWKPRASSSYAVAKAAEIHLAPALAVELARERIRVNTLSPGSVMFEGGRWARTRAADPEAHDRFVAENLPAGRFVSLEEVADAACFLLSPRGAGINGAHIAVDGAQDRPDGPPRLPLTGRARHEAVRARWPTSDVHQSEYAPPERTGGRRRSSYSRR